MLTKEKIKVGVLDSGFNLRFESMFEDQTIEYGYDFIDQDDSLLAEYNLHGTYVSYLIAGTKHDEFRGVDLDIPSINQKGEQIKTMISGPSYATAIVSGIVASSLLSDLLSDENLADNDLYTSNCLDCRKFIL